MTAWRWTLPAGSVAKASGRFILPTAVAVVLAT